MKEPAKRSPAQKKVPKAVLKYQAMKPRERNQYLRSLSEAKQIKLAMQLSEAGA